MYPRLAVCDYYLYGINCSKTCSKTCKSQACNHVNGDCIALQKVCSWFYHVMIFFSLLNDLIHVSFIILFVTN